MGALFRLFQRIPPRAALLATLAVAWLNFLTTSRWAAIPGALNGPKRPWFAAALVVATILALSARGLGRRVSLGGATALFAGGWILLGVAYLQTFPPSTWRLIPFLDDWPPRFEATIQGVWLLAHGAVVGWNWGLLGGYQSSADLNQSLTALGSLPIAIFGGPLGYHVLHAALIVAIPLVVYADLVREWPRPAARLAGFLVLLGMGSYVGVIMPSGDTNSIAGVLCAVIAITGSRHAQRGSQWGGVMLAIGLTLAMYTHAAFFVYSSAYLVLEALVQRQMRLLVRWFIAAATALVASLPQHWELLRYPGFFLTNNIVYEPVPWDFLDLARRLYYNVEMLFFPHRWFNDYNGLTNICLPIVLWVAVRARREVVGFAARCLLLTIFFMTIDVPEFGGYLFARAVHMVAVFTPIVLAWFIAEQAGTRKLAWSLVALVGLYLGSAHPPIPHVTSVRDFDPALFDHVKTLDGPLVLLEGSPHRDLIVGPERSERTPFGTHFDALMVAETGRRFYAQEWDGFHWTPFRGQTVAAGSFRGRRIDATPVGEFVAEMRKWGVRHLVVWSTPTKTYLDAATQFFDRRWSSGLWAEYELRDPDVREVVVETGSGRLGNLTPLSGSVSLTDVREGETVVVRANYFPAWMASADSQPVPLRSLGGQLAFDAPRSGSYEVALTYPRRRGLILLSLAGLVLGCALLRRL
jgi:hypothetical protein